MIYRILGLDPGTNYMGYGILEVDGRTLTPIVLGDIDLHKICDPYDKLRYIFERVRALVTEYSPKEVAAILAKEIDENPELETEYIEIIDADTLRPVENWNDAENLRLWCAVYARPVRLIDNIGL